MMERIRKAVLTYAVQVDLVNNNDSVGISAGALPNLYTLQQFHFHWGTVDSVGSEHTIDGHQYPMEVESSLVWRDQCRVSLQMLLFNHLIVKLIISTLSILSWI